MSLTLLKEKTTHLKGKPPSVASPLYDLEILLVEQAKYLEEDMLATVQEVCSMQEVKPTRSNPWWTPHMQKCTRTLTFLWHTGMPNDPTSKIFLRQNRMPGVPPAQKQKQQSMQFSLSCAWAQNPQGGSDCSKEGAAYNYGRILVGTHEDALPEIQ